MPNLIGHLNPYSSPPVVALNMLVISSLQNLLVEKVLVETSVST